MRVLVVEDDARLRYAIGTALRGAGFAVDEAADLPQADEALFVYSYDCVTFDRMLPAGDAADYVAARRRGGWQVPALLLTARDTVSDRVAGFEAGADDYLVKPFAVAELVARVRNLCRRVGSVRATVLRVADLVVDCARHQVFRSGVLLSLSAKEFAVLEALAVRAEEVVKRTVLIEQCWDELAEPSSNVVDVLIGQLRRKLGEPPLITTVRGIGYMLAEA